MMANSTREKLLSIVDDMELLCRELIDNLAAPKPKKLSPEDRNDLTKLLVQKDRELKETLELAAEQGKIEEEIRAMEVQVQTHDDSISQLQKRLKEAEALLSTSIFQAKQKLLSIEMAQKKPVQSEEIIKYAHRISASNAVCAPLNWQQGDPRRPYPTDLEMRLGFVGKTESGSQSVLGPEQRPLHPRGLGMAPMTPSSGMMTSPSMNTAPGMTPPGGPDFHMFSSQSKMSPRLHPSSQQQPPEQQRQQQQQQGHFIWQGSEAAVGMRDVSHGNTDGGNKGSQDDVEVMSTDSSSSSSTDSN